MASQLEIWNMALSMLGTRSRVADTSEDSTEAQQCSIWFAPARDAALRAFDWNFARRYLTLALRADVTLPSNWAYAYSYPPDCLRFRGIQPMVVPPVKFQVSSADAADVPVKVIFTNAAQAEGWYTRRIEDTTLFDSGFVRAMAAVLAAHIALPVTQKDSTAKAMGDRAMQIMLQATADDANEGVNQVQRFTPEDLAVRGFSSDDDASA